MMKYKKVIKEEHSPKVQKGVKEAEKYGWKDRTHKTVQARLDGMEEGNRELQHINELYEKINKVIDYAENVDREDSGEVGKAFSEVNDIRRSVKKQVEGLSREKYPDIHNSYERLKNVVDNLFGLVLANSPGIEVIDIVEKERDEDGEQENCRVFYVDPNKEYFDKDDDKSEKPDYYDWEEAQRRLTR